ncbi:CBFD-NFYB-HMF domain-containing protein [Mycena kentingensis (nom. inval.)]|nr:CBFD-NFYB-HMF domain-containing protein [Mycena kentingensis (nom. inval.)]
MSSATLEPDILILFTTHVIHRIRKLSSEILPTTKSDPDVKMIAADAPVLFCKACEIFIAEITARAFIVADSNKRRTLSRADIAKALTKSDQFDFLIDIVPREEPYTVKEAAGPQETATMASDLQPKTEEQPETSPAEEVFDQLESLLGGRQHPHPHAR